MAPTRVILMSCGSYNPPTNMHLRMFEIARDHLHRMGTHVVVGGVISPVHDAYAKKELASATHRCAMLRLALQNSDWIRLSTWETRQSCWTKTRLSLQHHQNLLNSLLSNSNDIKHYLQIEDMEWIPENVKNSSDNTPVQIKLLCGADLLESFGICGLWLEEDIDAIVGEHGLVVITREGSNPNKFIYDSDILSKHMHNICIVTEWIPNEVSSTRIRRALKRGESVRYLLQDSVIDYINKHEIYDTRALDTTIKLELSSPNANNYLHIDSRYLSALFLTPSPSDVTMDSPSPVEIAASIDVPDAAVLRRNMQNTVAIGEGGLNVATREQQSISCAAVVGVVGTDNGNGVKHVIRTAYPGQAKQIIASGAGVARVVEVGPQFGRPMTQTMSQPDSSSRRDRDGCTDAVTSDKDEAATGQGEVKDVGCRTAGIAHVDLDPNNDALVTIDKCSFSSRGEQSRDRESAIADDVKEAKSTREMIVNVNVDSSEIVRTQPGPSKSSELVGRGLLSGDNGIAKSAKASAEPGEASESRCQPMEIVSIDSSVRNDRVTKTQHSSELRLGDCCWPTRENVVNDSDRKTISDEEEKEIITDVRSGDTRAFASCASRRLSSDADNDGTSIDRAENNEPKRNYRLAKDAAEGPDRVDADVVKVQPLLSDTVALRNDHLESQLDETETGYRDNVEYTAVDADNIELIGIDNREIAPGAEVVSRWETIDSDKRENTKTTANIWIDGRYECALSDFSVDKEDYQRSQYGSDDDDDEKGGEGHAEEVATDKKADGKSIDKSDDLSTIDKIDRGATSSEESDRSKVIAEISQRLPEADNKSSVENGERTEMSSGMSEATSCEQCFEIDGKYLKSVVNSRKSPRKIRDDPRDSELERQRLEVSRADASAWTRNCEKVAEEGMRDASGADHTVKADRVARDYATSSRAERDAEDSAEFIPAKSESLRNAKEFLRGEGDDREFSDRTDSASDKEAKKTSRSNSTKKPKKGVEKTDGGEGLDLNDQDRSVSDHEVTSSRSEKNVSQKVFANTAAKSPRRDSKKNKIISRSDEMRDYDRSVNDRVISQLEAVFHDSSSKKSLPKAAEEDAKSTSGDNFESKKLNQLDERSRFEEPSKQPSRTSSTKSLKKTRKSAKTNDTKEQPERRTTGAEARNNADSKTKRDFNEIKDVYTRKVRRYNVPLQGSLDSVIAADAELSAQKPKTDDAFAKKSKSYESIKRIQEVFLGVPRSSAKANNSDSQIDIPDEFCSICCYMNDITFRTEEEVSSNQETFYTLRSTCSSLGDDDDDSIECDICGPLNHLQESADASHDGKPQDEIPCELCRICDEVNGGYGIADQDPADKYVFKVADGSNQQDECFEIENCGAYQGAVETSSADDRSGDRGGDAREKEKPQKDQGKPASLFIHSSLNRDQPRELYFIPKDEIAILTSGARKIGRKGSLFRKKEDFGGNARDNNRRYSSVDSLQLAKMAAKASDRSLKVAEDPALIGSADNLQISGDAKKPASLQKPVADDDPATSCPKSAAAADNLDSLAESQEKESDADGSDQKDNARDKEAVKMILTQHGIKIISEKETAL